MNSTHSKHTPIKPKLKPLGFIFSCLLTVLLLQSCASKYVTNYQPLKPVATSEYCQADLIGTTQSLTQKQLIILNDKQRIKDEITIALMLKSAAMKIVEQTESMAACQQAFTQGAKIFNQRIQHNQKILASEKGFDSAKDTQVLKVQKRITDLWRADQSARATLVGFPRSEEKKAVFWANRLASAHTIRIDREATQYVEYLLKQYDWIDQQRFGVSVSAHAWILIQHADDRVDLQAEVLRRMEPYFKNGGVRPSNYAYLWDRVAVNSGELQRYGTQPIWECKNGQLALQPIEDMDTANELRKALGMTTVEAGLVEMAQSVCGNQ